MRWPIREVPCVTRGWNRPEATIRGKGTSLRSEAALCTCSNPSHNFVTSSWGSDDVSSDPSAGEDHSESSFFLPVPASHIGHRTLKQDRWPKNEKPIECAEVKIFFGDQPEVTENGVSPPEELPKPESKPEPTPEAKPKKVGKLKVFFRWSM